MACWLARAQVPCGHERLLLPHVLPAGTLHGDRLVVGGQHANGVQPLPGNAHLLAHAASNTTLPMRGAMPALHAARVCHTTYCRTRRTL